MDRYTHGGNLYKAAREAGGDSFLDFSANINPLGLSPIVTAALQAALPAVIHYPDPEAVALREALTGHYGMSGDSLVLGNGAAELFYLLCLVRRPENVFISPPSFSEYERSALAAGAQVRYVPLKQAPDYSVDWTALQKSVGENSLVFLGHPNNPTGNLLDLSALDGFLAAMRGRNNLIVVDESFLDFVDADGSRSCQAMVSRYSYLAAIRSLTKIFAIPGLRLGFGVMASDLALALNGAKDQWNVNTLAQVAGAAALNDEAYLSQTRKTVPRWREQLVNGLAVFPAIQTIPSAVNFLLLDLTKTGKTGSWWRQAFWQKRILVRDCGNYVALSPYHIRIAVRTERENERFLAAMQEIMEELK